MDWLTVVLYNTSTLESSAIYIRNPKTTNSPDEISATLSTTQSKILNRNVVKNITFRVD